jgi:VWFA-related protein
MKRPLLQAAVLVVAGSAPAWPQTPTFSTKVEAVRLDVLVTDKGHPVRGLRAADFEVRDNGVLQQVDLVRLEQLPVNLILALDMSASVAGDRLADLRGAGRMLLHGLDEQDSASLVTFSHRVRLGSAPTRDVEQVRAALDAVEVEGETALVDGAYSAMMFGETGAGRSLLIVFSDGMDTSSWLTPDAVLETANTANVVAYAVSAGSTAPPFLKDLTRFTGGTLYQVESTINLSSVLLGILDEFRQRYLVSYSPRGATPEGWHQIEVRIKNRNVTVKARPGYLADVR